MSEALTQARHDLGKYIALNLRWLPDAPTEEQLRAALITDLRATRSGGGVQEDAWSLWQRLRPGLTGYNLEDLDSRMERIRQALPGLEQLDAAALGRVAEDALAVGPALRRLAG
ncbi:MAG TPA: hypothetical protein PLA94_20145 [Myxococcota bacterium]|nr:hypothetical protein [Myxococcota bacterium]